MILDLQHISETPIHNFKGGDGMVYTRMYSDNLNRIMLARITPGSSIGMHTHETNSEIVYVLSGTARIMMDDGEEIVHAGQTHYCPKGHRHATYCEGNEDLVIYAVVPEHGQGK